MKHFRKLAFLMILCCASVALALPPGGGVGASQKTHRGFEGKVTDSSGKILKDVLITLFNVDATQVDEIRSVPGEEEQKALSGTTSKHGRYRFVAVRPGLYRIRYELPGYQTLEKLVRIERSVKDAVMNIQLKQLVTDASVAGSN